MSNANVTLVQGLYAAFGKGDIATIIKGLAADVDWHSIGRPEDFPIFAPRKGAAAVQQFFQQVSEHEEFSEFSPQEFHPAGDKVFVQGRYALKLKKTGKPVACEWVHVFTIRNGTVVMFREYTDTAQFARAFRG
jgi:uncharacterized protein